MKFLNMYSRNPKQYDMENTESEETIAISYDDLPEAQDWKDGETYEIAVRQVSHDKNSASFEVLNAGTEEDEDNNE